MGHRDLLVTQNLSQPSSNTAPLASRVASAAGRLRSNELPGQVGPGTQMAGSAAVPVVFAKTYSQSRLFPKNCLLHRTSRYEGNFTLIILLELSPRRALRLFGPASTEARATFPDLRSFALADLQHFQTVPGRALRVRARAASRQQFANVRRRTKLLYERIRLPQYESARVRREFLEEEGVVGLRPIGRHSPRLDSGDFAGH